MYSHKNFKTKKELKQAVEAWNAWVAAGKIPPLVDCPVTLFAPGLGSPKENGWETVEGPHFPQPHKWYAQVFMVNGVVTKVK